ASIPVATLPGVEQRSADSREALPLYQVITAVDGELVRIAGTQHVADLAPAIEVETGAKGQVQTIGLDLALVEEAVVDLVDRAALVRIADQRARRAGKRGRVVAIDDIDQLLRTEEGDAILDLDVPVVKRQVQPVRGIPHHAERILGRLFGAKPDARLTEGIDLHTVDSAGGGAVGQRVGSADRIVAVEYAGGRIADRVGRERGL